MPPAILSHFTLHILHYTAISQTLHVSIILIIFSSFIRICNVQFKLIQVQLQRTEFQFMCRSRITQLSTVYFSALPMALLSFILLLICCDYMIQSYNYFLSQFIYTSNGKKQRISLYLNFFLFFSPTLCLFTQT